ncbi:MAG: hypothetical protein HYU51_04590 [Candidatus Rokubacteria bacterium]|nr:hypothetical protein [Candidatus Rokubacteria bacterium]
MTERALLAMAREVATLATRGGSLREALAHIARTSSERELRRARLDALLDEDETRALSLAWAREQLRLALEELIAVLGKTGAVRTDIPAPTLAWVLLAACEAIALEPPGDTDDRVDALLRVSGPRSWGAPT